MRVAKRIGGVLAALLLAYGVAAAIGGMIPVNRGWRQPDTGVLVYVVDNGIHTDLALPTAEFRDLLRPDLLGDPRFGGHRYALFGWGDRDFYLNTPSWWDVDPWRIGKAMMGAGATVMHVHHVAEPPAAPDVRPLMLSPAEYARLVSYVRGSFAPGLPVRGYGASDAFYPARGAYSALRTCNEWTARGLRAAGVRTALWAPVPWNVMRWL